MKICRNVDSNERLRHYIEEKKRPLTWMIQYSISTIRAAHKNGPRKLKS